MRTGGARARLTFIRTTKPKKMNPNQDRYGWKGAVDKMMGDKKAESVSGRRSKPSGHVD